MTTYTFTLPTKPTIGNPVSKSLFGDLVIDDLDFLNHEIAEVHYELFVPTTDVTVGNGKKYDHIGLKMAGKNLVYVHAMVVTAGTTGLTSIQIYNVTDSVNMLSTVCSIDSGETGSNTAATPYVIDTAHDDVAENDEIRIDVTAVSTTAPKGLVLTLGWQRP